MTLNKLKGKFIGANQIKKASKSENKTYLGNEKIRLEYESGKTEEYPKECLDSIITKDVSDPSNLRETRVIPVTEKLLTVLAESELTIEDIQYVIGVKLVFSIEDSIRRLLASYFGKEVRNATLTGKITLKDLDDALEKENKKTS
jgi:hypothetical protein